MIDLLKYVGKIATKWKDVGIELGLLQCRIDIIEHDERHSCEEACKTMLLYWYKQNPHPSREKLEEAIERCDKAVITNCSGSYIRTY